VRQLEWATEPEPLQSRPVVGGVGGGKVRGVGRQARCGSQNDAGVAVLSKNAAC